MSISFLLPLLVSLHPVGKGPDPATVIDTYFKKDGWGAVHWDQKIAAGPVRGLYLEGWADHSRATSPTDQNPARDVQLGSRNLEKATGQNWGLWLQDYSLSERNVEGKPRVVLLALYYRLGDECGTIRLASKAFGLRDAPMSYSVAGQKEATKTLKGLFAALKTKFSSK